jgi:hypothetical protein
MLSLLLGVSIGLMFAGVSLSFKRLCTRTEAKLGRRLVQAGLAASLLTAVLQAF